jgi:hypothetical protein
MKKTGFCIFLSVSGIFFLNSICDESLPPREMNPLSVYEVSLGVNVPNPDYIRLDTVAVALGNEALVFNAEVLNTFDETLFGKVKDPLGKLAIWWKDDSTIKTEIPIFYMDESGTQEFTSAGVVYFDPGDTIKFEVLWKDWKDDQGNPMWHHVDRMGSQYPPMAFVAEAQIQFFDETTLEYSNSVEFRVFFTVSSKMLVEKERKQFEETQDLFSKREKE